MSNRRPCRFAKRPAIAAGGGILLFLLSTVGTIPSAFASDKTNAISDDGGYVWYPKANPATPISRNQQTVTLDQVISVLTQARDETDSQQFGSQVQITALQLALALTHYTENNQTPIPGIIQIADGWQAADIDTIGLDGVEGDATADAQVGLDENAGATILEGEEIEALTELTVRGHSFGLANITWDDVSYIALHLAALMSPDTLDAAPVAIILPEIEQSAIELSGDEITYSSLSDLITGLVSKYGKTTDGYANGRLPQEILCALPFAPGQLSRCDAAGALIALNEAFKTKFGYDLPIGSSYRPFETQVQLAITKPRLAANPGYSMHGWGLAVDFGAPISSGLSPQYEWLIVNGPTFGWDNPAWARLGSAKPEPWHFEFVSASRPAGMMKPAEILGVDVDSEVSIGDQLAAAYAAAEAAAASAVTTPAAGTNPVDPPSTPFAGTEQVPGNISGIAPVSPPAAPPAANQPGATQPGATQPGSPTEPGQGNENPGESALDLNVVCQSFWEGKAYNQDSRLQAFIDMLFETENAKDWDAARIIQVLQLYGYLPESTEN